MGKLAFLFAGQGAQYPGMGWELADISPAAAEVFSMAEALGQDIKALCGTPAETLNQTLNAQPALFCVGLAAARALTERRIIPDCAAGFSLGEIPAMAFAGMLSDAEAFALVLARAALMQEASQKHPGCMLAVIGLPAGEVEEICQNISGAFPANYNSEAQTVVAAGMDCAGAVTEAVKARKGRAVRLKTSGAFHCPLMDDAAGGLAAFLRTKTLCPPRIPLYANRTGALHTGSPELVSRQVNSPVLWRKTIEAMLSSGVETFVEAGPGTVLGGIVSKIAPRARVYNVENRESLERTVEALGYAER